MLFIITGYYSKSLINSPIFSIMHNSRKICILPNFHICRNIYKAKLKLETYTDVFGGNKKLVEQAL